MRWAFGAPAAGLVIRTEEVELLVMQGKQVSGRVRVPLANKDDMRLIQAIQQAVAEAGLKSKRVAVSIPTQEVLFRSFTLPLLPKAEWDAAIQFEARKYIPFKTETLIWDYQVAVSSASKKMEVVFAAIQREAFHRLQQVLGAAGVQPTLIEPRSVSLARLARSLKDLSANECLCLVDVEPHTAHLAIVRDGMPYLTRDVSLTVAGALPSEAGDQRAERLLSELRVSIDFFMREYASTNVRRVLLFGDETLISPWCAALAGPLRCPVELGGRLLPPHVDTALPLSFASAVGLLQAPKEKGGSSLNFLKRVLAKAAVSSAKRAAAKASPALDLPAWLGTPQTAVSVGVVAALMLGAVWVADSQGVTGVRRQLEQLSAARPDVGWNLQGRTAADLQPVQEKAQAQLTFLKQIMTQRVSLAAKLDGLARALPDGVWITAVTFEDVPDAQGKGQFHMAVTGACYLDQDGKQLSAIQALEERVKKEAKFFNGFQVARIEQINATLDRQHIYRTFQLNCNSERRL